MIKVVGAVIEKEGSIFCAKRGPGKALAGLWELPELEWAPADVPTVELLLQRL